MSKVKPVKPADPNALATAAGLAFAANVRQRVARLWRDVAEFRDRAADPAGPPLHGVFPAKALFPLSAALEHADQAATDLLPAAPVDLPDLHTGLRAFGG